MVGTGTMKDMMGRDTNEHAPPSSAEEAAALLGAAISITDSLLHAGGMSSSRQSGLTNPPQGMHSIFAVQTPLPNQILFVRLVNLRAWLRWHATNTDADGLDDSVSVQQISNTAISTMLTKMSPLKKWLFVHIYSWE